MIVGIQIFFSSFLLSILGLRRDDQRATELRDPVASRRSAALAPRGAGARSPARLVWRVAGGSPSLGVILLVRCCSPRTYFLGSNSVAARDYVAPAQAGSALCVRDSPCPRARGASVGASTPRTSRGSRTDGATFTASDGWPRAARQRVRFRRTGLPHGRHPAERAGPAAARRSGSPILPASAHGGQVFVWGAHAAGHHEQADRGRQAADSPTASRCGSCRSRTRSARSRQLPRIFDRASLFRPGLRRARGRSGSCCSACCRRCSTRGVCARSRPRMCARRRMPRRDGVALLGVRHGGQLGAAHARLPGARRVRALRLRPVPSARRARPWTSTQGKRPPWSTDGGARDRRLRELTAIERPEAKLRG